MTTSSGPRRADHPLRQLPRSRHLQFTSNTTFSNAGGYAANSIKLAPSSAGQSLNLSNAGNLNTGAILLAGGTDFSITSTGGGGIADVQGGAVPGPRYFQVQQAVC